MITQSITVQKILLLLVLFLSVGLIACRAGSVGKGNDEDQPHISLIEMVCINPGTFTMGSPADEPERISSGARAEIQREVTLTQGFYMGKYPITQEQYEDVMGNNPSFFHGGAGTPNRTPADGEIQEKRPVEQVSWFDAVIFCNKLSIMEGLTPAYEMQTEVNTSIWNSNPDTWGTMSAHVNFERWNNVRIVAGSTGYRLPTEAQWEYACRAGTTTPFNTGLNITTIQANYDGRYPYNMPLNDNGLYRQSITQVGIFEPNDFGLHDMHGNVREWCWDWFEAYASGPQIDPVETVAGSSRVIRGGCWGSDARFLRSASRGGNSSSSQVSSIGFRVVRP